MKREDKKTRINKFLIEEKNLFHNTVFFGDRKEILPEIKEKIKNTFENIDVFSKQEINLFEIEKLNMSVFDIRNMISFVNKTSVGVKIVLLSAYTWNDECQNAMLKVLEETPSNTYIYLFGLNEKVFLKTVLSRLQKVNFKSINRYFDEAFSILKLNPNERLENKIVKKILNLKAIDYDYKKDEEKEKKDKESHLLFLNALLEVILYQKEELKIDKNFQEKILQISTISDIEGGSPHLFIEWLLLSTPKIP